MIDPEGSLGLVLSLKIGILLITIFEIFDQNWPFYVLMVSFYFYALFFRPSYLNLHMYTNQRMDALDALDEPCTFQCPL